MLLPLCPKKGTISMVRRYQAEFATIGAEGLKVSVFCLDKKLEVYFIKYFLYDQLEYILITPEIQNLTN